MTDIPANLIGGSNQDWPPGLKRLPGEHLKSVESVPWVRPTISPDTDALLARMANAETVDEIGKHGLAVASRAMEQRRGEGLYEAEYARDALVMAKFGHDRFPALTEATVHRLAEVQGLSDSPIDGPSDREQRGRIPHEVRPEGDRVRDLQTARFGWQWPYFGSVDATPLFVSAAARAEYSNTGFLDTVVTQADGVDRLLGASVGLALSWVLRKLEESPNGVIETTMASNNCWQVWEDSPDAYHHSDGRLARGSVASIEVQAFAYDALTDIADLLDENPGLSIPTGNGSQHDATQLRQAAETLRASVLKDFWIESDGQRPGYLAMGLERHEGVTAPLAIRSINMGLVLDTRLLEGAEFKDHASKIIEHLTDPNLGWAMTNGIPTLASDSPRFRPQGYHNGTQWPWTNYVIAAGLLRHDRVDEAKDLMARNDRVCADLNCSPEYVQGTNGREVHFNDAIVNIVSPDGNGGEFEHRVMQPGQLYQGWTVFGHDWSQRIRRELVNEVSTALAPELPSADRAGPTPEFG